MKFRFLTLIAMLAMTAALLAQDATSRQGQPEATHGTQAAREAGSMNNQNSNVNLTTGEREFLSKAAQANQAEVDMGRLALEKSSDPSIKEFAQRMVDDHGQNGQQVRDLAKRLDVTVPNRLPSDAQMEKDRLSRMSGAQFDRAYATLMLHDHRNDVAEFKSEQGKARNPDVKQYVDQTTPVLEQHLQMAAKLGSHEQH